MASKTSALPYRTVGPPEPQHRGTGARRPEPASEVHGRLVLRYFDSLRTLAARPGLDPEVAGALNDQAWTMVEDAAPVRLSMAADVLGVSVPTVRKWRALGLLEEESKGGSGPSRVTLESVAEVGEIASALRAAGTRRDFTRQLLEYLEADALLSDVRLRESLSQWKRGEYAAWPPGFDPGGGESSPSGSSPASAGIA